MNLEILIPPTNLRDYAKDLGWVLLKEAAKDRLYVMSNPSFSKRQLVFPMDTDAPDYAEAVMLTVAKLADLEGKTPQAVFDSIVEVSDDSISFRVSTLQADERALPLDFASSMVTGVQQLLLASACTVLKPQAHHPRLRRTEAQRFLDSTKFRHTRPGSFILNISCPVQAMNMQPQLLPNEDIDVPFVRRTTTVLHRSLSALATAIETDSQAELVADSKQGTGTIISSNLCEALTRFEDKSLRNSLEISIGWAAAIPRPKEHSRISVVRIQHDYFHRIEEIGLELRSNELQVEDIFPATVERLDGEMGDDGRRAGEVILSLLTPEGELVRARATLTADQYVLADDAHMTEGAFVKVAGKLHPGRQPRQLSDISSFERMN